MDRNTSVKINKFISRNIRIQCGVDNRVFRNEIIRPEEPLISPRKTACSTLVHISAFISSCIKDLSLKENRIPSRVSKKPDKVDKTVINNS